MLDCILQSAYQRVLDTKIFTTKLESNHQWYIMCDSCLESAVQNLERKLSISKDKTARNSEIVKLSISLQESWTGNYADKGQNSAVSLGLR